MICSNCKMRWAPLPENWPGDSPIIHRGLPRSLDEEAKRKIVFDNDEIVYCGCMEEED